MKRLAFVLGIAPLIASCALQSPSHRDKADSYFSEGSFERAIHEYERHIQERLKLFDRPQWENPYLYYLDIGDAYLRMNRPDQALSTYLEAEERGVEVRFVNDRIRSLGRWYEENGDSLKAIELLKEYRERDPLLFDMMLDRISRELVKKGYNPSEKSEPNKNTLHSTEKKDTPSRLPKARTPGSP